MRRIVPDGLNPDALSGLQTYCAAAKLAMRTPRIVDQHQGRPGGRSHKLNWLYLRFSSCPQN